MDRHNQMITDKLAVAIDLLVNIQSAKMSWRKADAIINTLVTETATTLEADQLKRHDVIKAKQIREAWQRLQQG
jgi:hypothetical protein|tara:strand:+ start:299 stop:520 length:222 start_codon:yes stop_codon:yes gene_type:complete